MRTWYRKKNLYVAALSASLVAISPTAQADLVNEDACAIWLCLPQGFLPKSCHKILLVFELRKANPFVPAIPPLNQCIVSPQMALTDLKGLSKFGKVSYSVSKTLKSSKPGSQPNTVTNTYDDCTAITVNGVATHKPYCFNNQVTEPLGQ